MQACRVLRHSTATARTSASITHLVCHKTRRSKRGRTVANAAASDEPSVSTLLQKTASLLPRTLSPADSAVGPDSSLFWCNILERSITELSSSSDQVPLTVAGKRVCDCVVYQFTIVLVSFIVCGFNKWACSHDLVTALLEDPFTSDPTYSDILRNRWKDAPSRINIE